MAISQRTRIPTKKMTTTCGTNARIVLYIMITLGFLLLLFVAYSVTSYRAAESTSSTMNATKLPMETFVSAIGTTEARNASMQYRLVYLYMEGCGHCERFSPTWQKFENEYGAEYSKRGIKLVSYEASSTEAKNYDVRGFPTVMLYKGSSMVSTFEDSRTIPSLRAFVDSHAK